jgi:hypothetical protein
VLGHLGFVWAGLSASCCHGDFIEGLSEKVSVSWGRGEATEEGEEEAESSSSKGAFRVDYSGQ